MIPSIVNSKEDMNLDMFHFLNKNGEATGVYDNAIFEYLITKEKIFVIGSTPYIYENGLYKVDTYGTKLKTMIRNCIYPKYRRASTVERVYKLFLIADELQEKTENLNQFPKSWINFQNGFYDPNTGFMYPHSPAYKAINQLPHEFDPSQCPTGTAVDEWLKFIAPNEDDREMLLEFIGYCLTTDTRQQKFLILCGIGGSGKSTVIRMIEYIIGEDNISHVSLKELSQRFASYGLLGKLLNSCADLEIGALQDTSILKKLLGEDSIRAEAKGKDATSFKSYARLIFSTNELPLVLTEKTNGFYRRLMVLKMDNRPAKTEMNYFEKLKQESDYFIHLCVDALSQMYKRGTILDSGLSKEAVNSLRVDSDSVEAWLSEKCIREKESVIERGYLFDNYKTYCEIADRTPLTRNSFYRALRIKGFPESRAAQARYFTGIAIIS